MNAVIDELSACEAALAEAVLDHEVVALAIKFARAWIAIEKQSDRDGNSIAVRPRVQINSSLLDAPSLDVVAATGSSESTKTLHGLLVPHLRRLALPCGITITRRKARSTRGGYYFIIASQA